VGRISFNATNAYYFRSSDGQGVHNNSVALQYKLGSCQAIKKPDPRDVNIAYPYCTISGSSSISLEYDWGTDIDLMKSVKQVVLKLTAAY
jgi:hypothetical protein